MEPWILCALIYGVGVLQFFAAASDIEKLPSRTSTEEEESAKASFSHLFFLSLAWPFMVIVLTAASIVQLVKLVIRLVKFVTRSIKLLARQPRRTIPLRSAPPPQ